MAATETLRPDEDVSTAWSVTTVANLAEVVLDPTAGDGSVCRALTADTGESQVFGFPLADGEDDTDTTVTYDHASVLVVKLYSHAVVDTSIDVAVRIRANANAEWSLYKSFQVSQTFSWQTCRFALPAPVPVSEVEPQVEILPSNIAGIGASYDLDVLYVQVLGLSLTTANSTLTKPEDSCFLMLCEDTGVQAWLRAESVQDAASRIYFEWNAPGEELFFESCPFIVISHTQPGQWNKNAVGYQNWLRPSGAVTIGVFDRDRFHDDIYNSRIAFKNFVADCELAIVNKSGESGYLSVTSISPVADLDRSDPEKDDAMHGGLWSASFQAIWGDT